MQFYYKNFKYKEKLLQISAPTNPVTVSVPALFYCICFYIAGIKGKKFFLFVLYKLYFRVEMALVDERTFFIGKFQLRTIEGMTALANHILQSY